VNRSILAALFWVLLIPDVSWAKCESSYSNNELAEDIVSVQELFDTDKLAEANFELQAMGNGITCLDKLAEPGLLARFSQLMAMSYFFAQDEDQAVRWALLAHFTDPDIPYTLASNHPFMDLVNTLEEPPYGQMEGKQLAPPDRGGIFLNGSLATLPIARAETPHLVQVFDGDGTLLGTFWQEGSRFQPGLLADGIGRPARPRWYRGPTLSYEGASIVGDAGETALATPTLARDRPPLTPIFISSGLALGSLATYVGASLAKSSLPNQTTGEGLTRARTTANALAVVSGVSLLGAAGVGATLLVDGRVVGVNVRF
jgi:hypothetical protein